MSEGSETMIVVASGRVGTVLKHDPDAEDLVYKLGFTDGRMPETDWFAADQVTAGTGDSVAEIVQGNEPEVEGAVETNCAETGASDNELVVGEPIRYPSLVGSQDDKDNSVFQTTEQSEPEAIQEKKENDEQTDNVVLEGCKAELPKNIEEKAEIYEQKSEQEPDSAQQVFCQKSAVIRQDLRPASHDRATVDNADKMADHSSTRREVHKRRDDMWDRLDELLSEVPIVLSASRWLGIPPVVVAIIGSSALLGFLLFGLGGELVCTLLGVLYPAFESFKAVEAFANLADPTVVYTKASNLQFWLTYWIVATVLSTVEYMVYFLLRWLPWYFCWRLLFIVWLYLPQTRGANIVYHWLVSPILRRNRSRIDNALEETGRQVNASTRRVRKSLGGAVGRASTVTLDYILKNKADEIIGSVTRAANTSDDVSGSPRPRQRTAQTYSE